MHDVATSSSSLAGVAGRHYALVKAVIPQCLIEASAATLDRLQEVKPKLPPWYTAATEEQKATLQALQKARCRSHLVWEKVMANLQSAEDFAQPLLEAALRAKGYDLDVRQTCLRIYIPLTATFGIVTAQRVKTLTLLQAALNNFEKDEAKDGFFDDASRFITHPNAQGHFERYVTPLKIEAFARLCRELDLGKKYQEHLTRHLRPTETVARNVLRSSFTSRHKDDFRTAAYIALLKGDITADDYALLVRIADGERRIKLGSQQVWLRGLAMMGLICTAVLSSTRVRGIATGPGLSPTSRITPRTPSSATRALRIFRTKPPPR